MTNLKIFEVRVGDSKFLVADESRDKAFYKLMKHMKLRPTDKLLTGMRRPDLERFWLPDLTEPKVLLDITNSNLLQAQ